MYNKLITDNFLIIYTSKQWDSHPIPIALHPFPSLTSIKKAILYVPAIRPLVKKMHTALQISSFDAWTNGACKTQRPN